MGSTFGRAFDRAALESGTDRLQEVMDTGSYRQALEDYRIHQHSILSTQPWAVYSRSLAGFEFASYFNSEIRKWGNVVSKANIKLE